MVATLIWLAASAIFLVDSHLLMGTMGDRISHRERQLWLAAPLLHAVLAACLTPWRLWAVAAVAVAVSAHAVRHLRWQRALMGRLRPASAELTAWIGARAAAWGAPLPARVMVSAQDGPAVFGIRERILVLPEDLPEAERSAVVAHELAHLRGRDPLKLWLVGVASTLLGWLPPARSVLKRLPLEIELDADHQAAQCLGDARFYAATLGRLGLRQSGLAVGVSLAGEPADLVVRLHKLADPRRSLASLYLPGWLPGTWRQRVARGSAKRAGRPVSRYFGYWLVGWLTAGYLALTGVMIHLLG